MDSDWGMVREMSMEDGDVMMLFDPAMVAPLMGAVGQFMDAAYLHPLECEFTVRTSTS